MKNTTFNVPIVDGPIVRITGRLFEYEGIQMAIHRALIPGMDYQPDPKGRYEATEISTGCAVIRYAKTQGQAMAMAMEKINQVGVDKTKEIIKKTLGQRKAARKGL